MLLYATFFSTFSKNIKGIFNSNLFSLGNNLFLKWNLVFLYSAPFFIVLTDRVEVGGAKRTYLSILARSLNCEDC